MTILLRTDPESKSEWVESISYDSLWVSRVDFYRLTLNTSLMNKSRLREYVVIFTNWDN